MQRACKIMQTKHRNEQRTKRNETAQFYFKKNAFRMWRYCVLQKGSLVWKHSDLSCWRGCLCRPLTLMSAEQCPIPGSLKSRSRGLEPGTKAGIRSSRSPTAFRNCTSNSDSGCRDKNQRNSCSEMRKLLAFYRENHKHMIKKHLIGYKSKLKKWDTLNVYF